MIWSYRAHCHEMVQVRDGGFQLGDFLFECGDAEEGTFSRGARIQILQHFRPGKVGEISSPEALAGFRERVVLVLAQPE